MLQNKMRVLKTILSFAPNSGHVGFKNKTFSSTRILLPRVPVTLMFDRNAHSQQITKNIRYISQDKINFKTDPITMKMDKEVDKPLCIIFNWLLSRRQDVMKYADLYIQQGFDVMSVSCAVWQLMWPQKGAQLVAADVLKFLAANESYRPLVVHGFSVGGYVYGEFLVHIVNNKARYQPVLDRVIAQIWDSVADISELTIGVPSAVFPKNVIMQKTLKAYMEYHLKTFHAVATSHYIRASQVFHSSPCRAPALFLLSRSDPVGAVKPNRLAHDFWQEIGMDCTWQCWDNSPHVQHYRRHKKEYLEALYTHLDRAHQLLQPDKRRMKISS